MSEAPIFTTGQRRALTLLASGMDDSAIAAKLRLAQTTVAGYLDKARRNLGLDCRAALVDHVARHGIRQPLVPTAAPTCRFTLYQRQPDGEEVEIHAYELACDDADMQAFARAALWTLPLDERQDLVVVTKSGSGEVLYRRAIGSARRHEPVRR